MARTKKQTIDAASARKRQIQEEILNESLALLGKRENIKSSSTEATNQKSDTAKSKTSPNTNRSRQSSLTWSSTDSSGIRKSSENRLDFPKAVICITDIYKSSPELLDSAGVKLSKNCSSPKSDGSFSRKPKYESLKLSICESMDVNSHTIEPSSSSPAKFKAGSEATPEHSPKNLGKSYSPSINTSGKHGRRSPRRQVQAAVGPVHAQASYLEPCLPPKPEKQKINIFTDNLGVDLGKRVRSPRRLSEDMIALPIYSMRRTGSSPKEHLGYSRGQDHEHLIELSMKRPILSGHPSGSHSCGQSVDPITSNYHTSQVKPDSLLSISRDDSLKKSKSQGKRLQTVTARDSISIQDKGRSEKLFSESSAMCDDSNISSSGDKGKTDVEFLMSSICKDIIGEVASEREYLFKKISKRSDKLNPDFESGEKRSYDKTVEVVSSVEKFNKQIDSSDVQATKIVKGEESVSPLYNGKVTNTKEQASSLLCAMLVGGTDVAQDYSQKKEKMKPDVADNSDLKVRQPDITSPDVTLDKSEENLLSAKVETNGIHASFCQKNEAQDQQDSILFPLVGNTVKGDEGCQENVSGENKVKNEEADTCPTAEDDKGSEFHRLSEDNDETSNPRERDPSHQCSHSSTKVNKEEEGPNAWKKSKIDFSSQLRKLNENILKLADIDVEEEFLTPAHKCSDDGPPEADGEPESDTKLYSLINNLGLRLKEDNTRFSESCDADSIDQLIKSCRKGRQQTLSSSGAVIWNKILERWKQDENKSERHENGPCPSSSSEKCANNGGEVNSGESTSLVCSDTIGLQMAKENKPESLSNVTEKEAENMTPPPSDKNTQSLYSTGSSSHNGSLCELDVDEMTAAAAAVLKKPGFIMDESPLNANVSVSKKEIEGINGDPLKPSLDIRAKRPLLKALTCSDFSSTPESKTLRRSSSSPQLYKNTNLPSTSSLMSSSSHEEGECTSKSKLGSKIPIPGTVFPSKFYKKSWRTPRIIMNPKPLKILLQLEMEGPKKDIFVSSELQKYLWMPSSRMIVTSAIREEIKRADETAKKAWDAKAMIMKEDEENLRKRDDDEEVNKNFSKHEPDFDEVEGMLFMSFSSEIELKAHIHVERALEWDKDDTMLRISRAKVFEETKAVNGNMKEVKMKRLRGQHMRWKKYKRMYSKEVDTLLDAKKKGIPFDQVNSFFRKTSDITKIKGWKHKPVLTRDLSRQCRDTGHVHDMENRQGYNPYQQPASSNEENSQTTQSFMSMDIKESLNEKKKDLSPKSRRQFNFSDRKAHRQLFKELNMDWEDRMIHRKLGGWSLKGNRPKAFSGAAIKRKKREMNNTLSPSMAEVSNGVTEPHSDVSPGVGATEPHSDVSPGVGVTEPHSDASPDVGVNVSPRKRKLVYPMLTEKLARKCLKTLETGDILRALRRKKKKRLRRRAYLSHLPALTLMPPLTGDSSSLQALSIPVSSSIKEEWSSIRTPVASSAPSVNSPLNLDLPDETVLEGVDIASRISSPSVTDVQSSPQVKACGKPGCRYGCICHLCSVNESPTPPESSLLKSPVPICDKEYCRLGCICDSLDPEQPTSTQAHCGKPSCMLECICSDSGLLSSQVEGSDDIPFLPSMKQRPRTGERFSNLPRREKTHRTAKNLDAVTRKALMLYETSEIFCEKVEKSKKKENFDFPRQNIKTGFDQSDLELIELEETISHERYFPPTVDTAMQKRKDTVFTSIDVEMTDVVQSLPVMEPSAHKRKRKSHPLSSEIFTLSTCARIQPYVTKKLKRQKLMDDPSVQNVTSSMLLMAGSSHFSPKEQAESGPKPADVQNNGPVSSPSDLKIASVTSLSAEAEIFQQKETVMCEHIDLTSNEDPFYSSKNQTAVKPPVSSSEVQESAKKQGVSDQPSSEDQSLHGWHTSMVCLKAKAPSKSEVQNEDDVQEEDEVKLLEFAADCNWDGSKRAILAHVASCLTRGHYPHPRTMNINEFVVEILPKAQQPTVIPPALRAKLPEQMYSIRVRITRRYDPIKAKLLSPPLVSEPMIDLCEPSPQKDQSSTTSPSTSLSSHLAISANSISSSCNALSYPSSISSHIGISSLSNIYVTSTGKQPSENTTKSKSAPGSRRSSLDLQKYDLKLNSSDDTSASLTSVDLKTCNKPTYSFAKKTLANTGGRPVNVSEIKLPTNLTFVKSRVQSTSSIISASSATPKVFSPLVQPLKFISSPPSLLKNPPKAAGSSKGKPVKSVVPATINAPNATILRPVNQKDLKYVHLPNKEPLMVYEVDVKTDKKTLIAVPLSLASMAGDMKGKPILTVPVPAAGQQKVLPLIASRPKVTDESSSQCLKLKPTHTPPQSVLVRIPCVPPSVMLPSEQVSKSHGLVNLLPVTVQNTSLKHVNIAKPVPISSKLTHSSGMTAFSGVSENKLGSTSPQSVLKPTNVKSTPLSPSTTVTQSRQRPIPSSEVSPVKKDFPKETFPSSVPSSKSEVSQENKLGDDKPISKLMSLKIPVSSEHSQQASKNVENISVEGNESKGMLEQSKLSLSPHNAFSEEAVHNKNNTSFQKDFPDSRNKSEVLCPVNGQNTHANSDDLDGNRICVSVSSSCHSSGPISEDESFSGFSVMKDISYPTLSSQNQSFVGLKPNKTPPLNSSVQVEDHEFQKESVKNESSSSSSQPSGASPNSESLAPESNLSRISSADVSEDNSCSLKESSLVLNENVLKRGAPDGCLEDDVLESKRSKLMGECLPPGEDEINLPNTSSPHSSCSRPKSGLSSVLSSVSSEDLIVNLSSEEEIDVGENSPADAFSSFQEQIERAWENDHSTMYCKTPQALAHTVASKGLFHKYLERARRAKLKQLLSGLADTVMSIPAMKFHLQKWSDVSTMPKVMILESAKRSIQHLEQVLVSDEVQISQLSVQNESLKRELQDVKAELMKRNMSGRAIAAIVNRISRQAKRFQEKLSLNVGDATDEIDGVPSQNDSPDSSISLDSDTYEQAKEPDALKCEEENALLKQEDSLLTKCVDISERIDVSKHETVQEDGAISQKEEVDESSSVPNYEDISDWESGACTSQEPIPQYEYEDITDEENDS